MTDTKKLVRIFVLNLAASCAPLPSHAPPPDYKGPIAEGPLIQQGDYWVYQTGDGRYVKVGGGRFLESLRFPLWIGKTWRYQSEAIRAGQPLTTKAPRLTVEMQCQVMSVSDVTLKAGKFQAFESRCQCTIYASRYDPDCGQFTSWYAPEVKNIVRLKTENTQSSLELVEYHLSGR